MSDTIGDLDVALERVLTAARDHLAAVKAADGQSDDESVWRAYVGLNNASHAYDELLNDVYGEVTPWDLEAITEAEGRSPILTSAAPGSDDAADDPYPRILSVRQRRDYRVPSVSALLRAAEGAREPVGEGESAEPAVTTVGEAVLELLQAGDGSLGMLDVPELDPLDGIVVVAEVTQPLDARAQADSEGETLFRLGGDDRTVARLDERTLSPSEAGSEAEPEAGQTG